MNNVAPRLAGSSRMKVLEKYKKTLLWSDKSNDTQANITLSWTGQTKEYQIYYVVTKYYHNSDNDQNTYGQYVFPGHYTMLVGKDTGDGSQGAYTTCRWAIIKPGSMHLSYGGSMYQWKIVDSADGGSSHCKVIEIYGLEGTEL